MGLTQTEWWRPLNYGAYRGLDALENGLAAVLHERVELVLDLFVVFLDAAQGTVEEPGLPEFAVGYSPLDLRVCFAGTL